VNEEEFVAAGVAVEIRHRDRDVGDGDRQVVVSEQRAAAIDCVGVRYPVRGPSGREVPVPQGVVRFEVGRWPYPGSHVQRRGRRVVMVQEGKGAGKSPRREEFLGVEGTVRAAKLGVPLGRDGSGANVRRHGGGIRRAGRASYRPERPRNRGTFPLVTTG